MTVVPLVLCDRVGRRAGGLVPARLHDLGDREGAGVDAREAVVAALVGGRRGDHVSARIEQIDDPGRQARLALILMAVAVQVVEDVAAERRQLEVAEVQGRRRVAADGRLAVIGRRRRLGDDPPAGRDLLDGVAAGADVRERVGPVPGRGRRGDQVVAAVVEVDGPAAQAGVAIVERAVAGRRRCRRCRRRSRAGSRRSRVRCNSRR